MSSSPGWVAGYTPPAAEWNTTFANKADESEMAAKANVTDLAAKLNAAGTATNDNAAAGIIGEYQPANSANTALTNNIAANVASLPLTAGDWDVWGGSFFHPAGTTTVSALSCGISTVSAALPGFTSGLVSLNPGFNTGAQEIILCGLQRLSLASPTTIFMVAAATFAVSTMTADGYINARRAR